MHASSTITPHQRADGGVALRFDAAPRGTVLRDLRQSAPMRALFPTPEPDEWPLAALVNTAGGLAGGDRVSLSVTLGAGARATVSTPAAEKLYRSLGPDTTVTARLDLGAGAVLEWLPQETILFDGARLRRILEIALAPGARLLAAEALVFGREARGERFARGTLRDAWLLRRDGAPLWADATRLPDPPLPALDDPFGFDGAGAFGTLVYVGDDAAALREGLSAALRGGPVEAGASLPRPGLLVGRALGRPRAVREALAAGILLIRAAALGLPARLPRLWLT